MKKRGKAAEVHLAKWISAEHREEVHEKVQRKVRHLHWNRALIEEGRNGGAVQQRGHGRIEICRLMRRESRMKEQAAKMKKHTYIKRSICGNRQQLGSSCWREWRSSGINPRQRG